MKNNFIRDVQWCVHRIFKGSNCGRAPDVSCLFTFGEDNLLRVMEMEHCNKFPASLRSTLHIRESDSIHGAAWYPGMKSVEPATAAIACVARDQPTHVWDAFTGLIRASYLGYDQMDELSTAYSVAWSPSAEHFVCGYEHQLRVFTVSRPGRECLAIPNKPTRYGHRGVMGCVAYSTDGSLLASASFTGSVCIYDSRSYEMLGITRAESGVTRVQFSLDGQVLVAGCRKSNAIQCWDIRNMTVPLFTLYRVCDTNQRIGFDMARDGVHLLTGSQDGNVYVYNLMDGNHVASYHLATDCVNSVSLSTCGRFVATGTGQRKFTLELDDDDDTDDDNDKDSNSETSSCDVTVWGLPIVSKDMTVQQQSE